MCYNYSGRITGTVLLINVMLIASQVLMLFLLYSERSSCLDYGRPGCDHYNDMMTSFIFIAVICTIFFISFSMYSNRYQRRLYNQYLQITSIINGDLDQNLVVNLEGDTSKMNKKLLMKGELPPAPVVSVYFSDASSNSSINNANINNSNNQMSSYSK
jgi:hypothetical protein